MTTFQLSPAHPSLPVFPDGDSGFDRTATPSPVGPLETLQQCGVSRVVQIYLSPLLEPGALIDRIEQAAALGYNIIHLTGGAPFYYGRDPFEYDVLEQLLNAARSLGYYNTLTTGGASLQTAMAQRMMHYLHHVSVCVEGKKEGQNPVLLKGLEVLRDRTNRFGLLHTLQPGSWKILSWLTDFALSQKASHLHLYYQEPPHAMHHQISPAEHPFTPKDLYRIFIAHYYLKTFSGPDLSIELDLLHRERLRCPPFLTKLVITDSGDLFPIAHGCASFFHIGHLHSGQGLEDMLGQFLKKKSKAITQLYNETYRDILHAGAGSDIVSWTVKLMENSYAFQSVL
ncbi:MAG TPA: radical SAM protein [Puia sp.]